MEVYENPAAILAYLLGFDAFRELLDAFHKGDKVHLSVAEFEMNTREK